MNKRIPIIYGVAAAAAMLSACGQIEEKFPEQSMPTVSDVPVVEYIETEPTTTTSIEMPTSAAIVTEAPAYDMTGTELATTFIDEYGNIYGFTEDKTETAYSPHDTDSSLDEFSDVPADEYYSVTDESEFYYTEPTTVTTPRVTAPRLSVTAPSTTSQTTRFVPEVTAPTTAGWPPAVTYTDWETGSVAITTTAPVSDTYHDTYDNSPAIISGIPDAALDPVTVTENADAIYTNPSELQIADENEKRIAEQNKEIKSSYTGKQVVMHPYSYKSLNDNEKYAYDIIVNAMRNYEKEVNFPLSRKMTFEELFNAYQCVYSDEVTLFYIDTLMEYVTDQSTGYVKNMRLSYIYSESQVNRMKEKINASVDDILSEITPSMSEYEIVLLLHDRIIRDCTYTTSGNDITSIYGVLADGKAQCQGYTRTFSYLCSLCGIETDIVLGIASEEHMWNMVKINGSWYHIDLTWDDPDKKQYPDSVRYDYFCLTTKRISELRTITGNSHELPEADSTDCQYYIRNELVAHNADEAREILYDNAYEAAIYKKSTIQFQCSDENAFNEISDELFGYGQDNAISILSEVNEIADHEFYTDSFYHNSNKNTYTIKVFLEYI